MIYLMRHGEIDGKGLMIGQSDLPLNATGLRQAGEWGKKLEGIPFEAIYCSDLSRSFSFAKIIAQPRDLPVHRIPELNEIDLGLWDGRDIADIRKRFPEQWKMRGADLKNFRPDGGESFSDLSNRVFPVFERLVKNHKENLLIAGHAGVNRVILCHVLGLTIEAIFKLAQDYGCLNLIEKKDDAFVLKALNHTLRVYYET